MTVLLPVAVADAARCGGLHQGSEETLQGEVGHVLLDEVRVEHRAVEGDEVGLHQKGAVEGGDVAVADEDFGVGADDPVIEPRQEPRGAVAAADAEDGLDCAVGEQLHQVAGAVAVAAGEEAPPSADVGGELGLEAEAFEDGYGAVNVLGVRRGAGGGDDSDRVAVGKAVRDNRHESDCWAKELLAAEGEELGFGLSEGGFEFPEHGGGAMHISGAAKIFELL